MEGLLGVVEEGKCAQMTSGLGRLLICRFALSRLSVQHFLEDGLGDDRLALLYFSECIVKFRWGVRFVFLFG